MRLVKISTPDGKGEDIARLAVGAGIPEATIQRFETYGADGSRRPKEAVDVKTSTPAAEKFIEAVMTAPFFDPEEYSIDVRQPRSVVTKESVRAVTWSISVPSLDLFEELWQFSHVTPSFILRMFIGAALLSYGMVKLNLLLMIAGLLFIPFLPMLLAVGFGALTKEWRLVRQGAFAAAVATGLIVAGGAVVALLTGKPSEFDEFAPTLTTLLISLAVGVAAGLATGDDVGRRELIGLAATAQMALIPAWFGISLVYGFSSAATPAPAVRVLNFFVAAAAILVTSMVTYHLLGMRGEGLRRYTQRDGG